MRRMHCGARMPASHAVAPRHLLPAILLIPAGCAGVSSQQGGRRGRTWVAAEPRMMGSPTRVAEVNTRIRLPTNDSRQDSTARGVERGVGRRRGAGGDANAAARASSPPPRAGAGQQGRARQAGQGRAGRGVARRLRAVLTAQFAAVAPLDVQQDLAEGQAGRRVSGGRPVRANRRKMPGRRLNAGHGQRPHRHTPRTCGMRPPSASSATDPVCSRRSAAVGQAPKSQQVAPASAADSASAARRGTSSSLKIRPIIAAFCTAQMAAGQRREGRRGGGAAGLARKPAAAAAAPAIGMPSPARRGATAGAYGHLSPSTAAHSPVSPKVENGYCMRTLYATLTCVGGWDVSGWVGAGQGRGVRAGPGGLEAGRQGSRAAARCTLSCTVQRCRPWQARAPCSRGAQR